MALVFGAMIGSFLNVCISRLPAGESIVHPRSRCPGCGTQIAWYDNIPVISWLLLRARCRTCGTRISALYPLIELATAVLWMGAFAAFGPTFFALRIAVFATVMLGIAVTDAREFLIPDGFTLFGLGWVLGTAFLVFLIGGMPAGEGVLGSWLAQDDGRFAPIGHAVVGACAGAGAVAIVGWLGEVALKREAMGFGDLTLMAVVGAAVGPVRALLTVFVGAVLAVLALPLLKTLNRNTVEPVPANETEADRPETRGHIPFGVFLAPAALIVLLWGDKLIQGYLRWIYTGTLG